MQASIFKLLLLWNGKIPQNSENLIQEKLKTIKPENVALLENLSLKNPNIALILCVFLGIFGIDDFYCNKNKLGALKLILSGIALSIVIIVYTVIEEFDDVYLLSQQAIMALCVVAMVLSIIVGVLLIVNLFSISEKTKKENLAIIEKYISMIS